MKNKKIITLVGLLALIPLIVFIIRYVNNDNIKNEETFNIGVVVSQTGDNAIYGKRSINGMKWAVEKLNNNHFLDKKIVLVVEDTRSKLNVATNAIESLISQGVKIVVGDIISGTTLAMAPIAEKNKVILFAPGASSPMMYNQGKYIFRNWTSDEYDGKAIALYALKKGDKKFGVIFENKDYTKNLASEFSKSIVKGGGKVVMETIENSNDDVSTQVLNMKENNIKSVYISAYSNITGKILKKAKELGYSPNWYSTLTVNTPDCRKIAGNLVESVVYTTPAIDLKSNEKHIVKYVTGFKEKFDDVPEETSAHAYDAIMTIAQAIKNSNSYDTESIRKELLSIKDFKGVTGITNFDNDGNVVKDIFIKTIKGENEIVLDTIVNK